MKNLMETSKDSSGGGFTLIELMCVIALVAAVAVLAVMRLGRFGQDARRIAAQHDMDAIRNAFIAQDGGYISDMEGIPGFTLGTLRISNLLVSTNLWSDGGTRLDEGSKYKVFTSWSEEASRGWRGPYVKGDVRPFPPFEDMPGFYPDISGLALPAVFKDLRRASIYGFTGEPTLFDPWGRPYVLQIPPPQAFTNVTTVTPRERFTYARIVSAGPDGTISTPCFVPNYTNETATSWNASSRSLVREAGRDEYGTGGRGDDLVLFIYRNDIHEEVRE